MKRIKVSFFAGDNYTANDFQYANKGVIEMEHFEEQHISKEKKLEDEYTFERLLESASEFANGIWHALKGFWGMAGWAIALMWEGLRFMWKGAFDKKEKSKDKKVSK